MAPLITRRIAVLVAVIGIGTTLHAQERRWEVEVYGGAVAGRGASDGSRTLPAAGAPLVTSNPIFPSREVPSWFFGDGAALLNGVVDEFGGAAKLSPLDSLFAPVRGGRTAAAGLRIRRRVSERMSAEVSLDWLGNSGAAPPGFAAAIESTRRSYEAAVAGVLATGPFSSVFVEAAGSSEPGSRREMSATAALNSEFRPLGAFTPYATFGGGILAGSGVTPSAELSGRYRFAILGEVPISESDRVTVRFEQPPAFVVVIGGGLRRDLSATWGLRFDVRVLVGPDSTRVSVDSESANARGTPAGFVESFTNPAIQFSNDPSTGRRSTLSAPGLRDAQVFSGGVRTRTVVTLGVSRRF